MKELLLRYASTSSSPAGERKTAGATKEEKEEEEAFPLPDELQRKPKKPSKKPPVDERQRLLFVIETSKSGDERGKALDRALEMLKTQEPLKNSEEVVRNGFSTKQVQHLIELCVRVGIFRFFKSYPRCVAALTSNNAHTAFLLHVYCSTFAGSAFISAPRLRSDARVQARLADLQPDGVAPVHARQRRRPPRHGRRLRGE